MKHSTDRILTTHAGSLSRPADLIALNRARAKGETADDAAYAQCLASAVAGVAAPSAIAKSARTPVVTGIAPKSVAIGQTLTVRGKNFRRGRGNSRPRGR